MAETEEELIQSTLYKLAEKFQHLHHALRAFKSCTNQIRNSFTFLPKKATFRHRFDAYTIHIGTRNQQWSIKHRMGVIHLMQHSTNAKRK